jgi:osmotically-inducible protein OsmY
MSARYTFHDGHDLQHHVHFILSSDPYVGRKDVKYAILDRDVLLTGRVQTYYQKQMAQESLRKISGIRRVVNELQVSGI